MMSLALSLLLPWAGCYWLVARCDDEPNASGPRFVLRLCLSLGIAIGLGSSACFLWLRLVGAASRVYLAVDLACFAAMAGGLWLARWRPPRAGDAASNRPAWSSGEKRLGAVLAVAMVLAVFAAVATYLEKPDGGWDAWAIWNQRARFLFRSGGDLERALSPVFAHPDYPLLVPCAIARGWFFMGGEPTWVPWLLGSMMTLATVGLVGAGVSCLRDRSQGLVAALAMLATVRFVRLGAMQYADVPLSFFMTATVLLLCLYDASPRPRGQWLWLAGLTSALGAWTKNEGALFLVAVPVARMLVACWSMRGKSLARELAMWAIGAAPLVVVLVLFKSSLDLPNDLIAGQSWEATTSRLVDLSRYAAIATGWVKALGRVALLLILIVPAYAAAVGRPRPRPAGSAGVPTAVVVTILVGCGYSLVYLTTPCDLAWHLKTSADRLVMHLWPTVVLATLLCVNSPADVFGPSPRQGSRAADDA